jgi:truncated hemoglobin YjbI
MDKKGYANHIHHNEVRLVDSKYFDGEVLGSALTFIHDNGQEMKYSVHDIFEINGRKYAILTGHQHETVMELREDERRSSYFMKVHEHEADHLLHSYRQQHM